MKVYTIPKKYCPDLHWEENIETGPLGNLTEYPGDVECSNLKKYNNLDVSLTR